MMGEVGSSRCTLSREIIMDTPPSFLDDDSQGFRKPFSFLRESIPGGFGSAGIQLMAAWAVAAMIPATFWAWHVAGFVGKSSLANHWGERLPIRDLLDLWWNGKWNEAPLGVLPVLVLLLALTWALWAGYRMQAEMVGARPRLGTWMLSLAESLLLGAAPLLLTRWILMKPVNYAGDLGIAPFSWASFLFKPLSLAATATAFFLMWSFIRVGRLATKKPWLRRMRQGFLALWAHPVQWTLLCFVFSLVRLAAVSAVVVLFWRLGGATVGRVWAFVLAQGALSALLAWTQGWQLRLATCFVLHDARVRDEQVRLLETAAVAAPAEA